LYGVVSCLLFGLIKRYKVAFRLALAGGLFFTLLVVLNKWNAFNQKKIIVYNVPAHRAIDFVDGYHYQFAGDEAMTIDGVLKNFHLKPGRISLSLNSTPDSINTLHKFNNFYSFYDKRVLLIDSALSYSAPKERITIDYIVISKNPRLFIPKLAQAFNAGIYVFDASNPVWKIAKWKKDCEELHLRFHSVPEQGAFVTDL
jgi:competence protein ComEC